MKINELQTIQVSLFSWIQKYLKDHGFLMLTSLMFKRISSRQKHFNIRISPQSCHPFNVKTGFIKGEALRLLRTNSDRDSFEARKRDFQSRLEERGYPTDIVKKTLSSVQFSSRQTALKTKIRTSKRITPLVTTYNPATPNLKKILMKHWHLLSI
jgi:hypothetical protein